MYALGEIRQWLAERADLWLLLAVLVPVLAIWAFIELADEVVEGETDRVDRRVLLVLRNPADLSDPIGPRWLEEAARDVSALGGVMVLTLLTVAVAGFLLLRRRYRALVFLLVAVIGGTLVSSILKEAFDRPRPDIVPHLAHVSTASFPSGHSMLSAVVYLTLGALLSRLIGDRRSRVYALIMAILTSVLVGVSRVYVGVHYPSDVLAGWTAGLAWAVLCWLAAYRLQQRAPIVPPVPADPAPELSDR